MRTSSLVLLLTVAAALYVVATPAAAVGGEWQPIPNVADDPHIQGLGQCAVDEHNKRTNCLTLKFVKVVSGKVDDEGTTYLLDVEAVRLGGSHAIYTVEVVDQSSSGGSACKLLSFGAPGGGC